MYAREEDNEIEEVGDGVVDVNEPLLKESSKEACKALSNGGNIEVYRWHYADEQVSQLKRVKDVVAEVAETVKDNFVELDLTAKAVAMRDNVCDAGSKVRGVVSGGAVKVEDVVKGMFQDGGSDGCNSPCLRVFINLFILFVSFISVILLGVLVWLPLDVVWCVVSLFGIIVSTRWFSFYVCGSSTVENCFTKASVFLLEILFGPWIERFFEREHTQQPLIAPRGGLNMIIERDSNNIYDEFTKLLDGLKKTGAEGMFEGSEEVVDIDCQPSSEIKLDGGYWNRLGHGYNTIPNEEDSNVFVQTNFYGDVNLIRKRKVIFVSFSPLNPCYADGSDNWSFDGQVYSRIVNGQRIVSTNICFNEIVNTKRYLTFWERMKLLWEFVVQRKVFICGASLKMLYLWQWIFGLRYVVDTYYIRSMRQGNFIISAIERIRTVQDSVVSEQQIYNSLHNPVVAKVAKVESGTVWGLMRSTDFVFGISGGHSTFRIHLSVYDQAVSQVLADPKISCSTISRLMTQNDVTVKDSTKMLYYFKSIIGAGGEFVPEYYGYTIHGSDSIFEVTDDYNGGARAMFPSIVRHPASVPSRSLYNDINTMLGRLYSVNKALTKFKEDIYKYLDEFADLVVPYHLVGTGNILTDTDYISTLDTEIKRQRYDRYVASVLPYFSETVEAFQKSEAYPSVGNPRNISAVNAGVLQNLARFTIPFKKDVLTRLKWYCPQLTPKQIAEKVSTLCQSDNIVETDMSRYDGTISYFLRYKLEAACYLKYFREEHRGELLSYINDEVTGNGITQFGIIYDAFGSRLSGSPFTTDGNTLINAFMFYVTQRRMGHSIEEISDQWVGDREPRFLAYGDDGLCDLSGDVVDQVAEELGLKLKVLKRSSTDFVGFLGRFFLNPKFSTDSIQDPARIYPKIHITFSTPMPDEIAIINKLRSFSYTDGKSPIMRALIRLVERSYSIKLNKLDTMREKMLKKYDRALAKDKRYILENNGSSECWAQTDEEVLKLQRMADSLDVTVDEILGYERYLDGLSHIKDIEEVLQNKPSEIKVTSSVNGRMEYSADERVPVVIRGNKVALEVEKDINTLTAEKKADIKKFANDAEGFIAGSESERFIKECFNVGPVKFCEFMRRPFTKDVTIMYYLDILIAGVISKSIAKESVAGIVKIVVDKQPLHPLNKFCYKRFCSSLGNRMSKQKVILNKDAHENDRRIKLNKTLNKASGKPKVSVDNGGNVGAIVVCDNKDVGCIEGQAKAGPHMSVVKPAKENSAAKKLRKQNARNEARTLKHLNHWAQNKRDTK